jgi:hypothetical protein
MSYSRRQFVRIVPALGAFAVPALTHGFDGAPPDPPVWPSPEPARGTPVDESFPSHHPSLAKEMVGVSHFNLARVKELVQQHPSLAKASWDWGYGDWETALGAASHVGNRNIAELLLANGAPPTLCSATMLGQLEVVKAFIAATPGVQRTRGPHGLSLMVHARLGGPPAAAVVSYLESLGDADQPLPSEPLSSEDRALIEGTYAFGERPRDSFVVNTDKQFGLMLTRAGATARAIRHLGRLEFAPAGAPEVRIRFERDGAKIVALTVSDPDVVVRGKRTM